MLKWIQYKLFLLIGPRYIKDLVAEIERLYERENVQDVAIYGMGTYQYQVHFADGPYGKGPFTFPTAPERDAFGQGVQWAMSVNNIKSEYLDEEETQAFEAMFEKTTHGGGGGTKH